MRKAERRGDVHLVVQGRKLHFCFEYSQRSRSLHIHLRLHTVAITHGKQQVGWWACPPWNNLHRNTRLAPTHASVSRPPSPVPGARRACTPCPSTSISLSREVVPQLKTRLRERGLPTSGKKADLIARLLESMDAEDLAATPPERHSGSPPPPSGLPGPADTTTTQETALLSDPSSKAVAAEELEHDAGAANGGGGGGVDGLSEGWAAAAADALIAGDFSSSRLEVPGDGGGGGGGGGEGGPVGPPRGGFSAESAARDRRVSGHATLVNLVSQCLDNVKHAQGGGVVSSRDLGRALAALPSPSHPSQSALLLLKSKWPSLMAFLKACPSEFTVTGMGNRKEFGIARNDGGGWEARGRVEGAGGEERSHRAPVGVTPVAADQ